MRSLHDGGNWRTDNIRVETGVGDGNSIRVRFDLLCAVNALNANASLDLEVVEARIEVRLRESLDFTRCVDVVHESGGSVYIGCSQRNERILDSIAIQRLCDRHDRND